MLLAGFACAPIWSLHCEKTDLTLRSVDESERLWPQTSKQRVPAWLTGALWQVGEGSAAACTVPSHSCLENCGSGLTPFDNSADGRTDLWLTPTSDVGHATWVGSPSSACSGVVTPPAGQQSRVSLPMAPFVGIHDVITLRDRMRSRAFCTHMFTRARLIYIPPD